jgi:fructose-1,6-bisphosphatase II
MVYMDKIAVGPQAKDVIDLNASVEYNLKAIARAKGEHVEDLLVIILDRPRHEDLIQEVRRCGARIRMIHDGDVIAAIMTAWEGTGIDVMMGVGGSPEAVIAACAMRCLGGTMQARIWPRTPEEAELGRKANYDLDKVLRLEDLVSSEDVFFAATGVTQGELLRGVDYYSEGARTESLVMRGLTGTVRRIESRHRLEKLQRISRLQYVV